MWSILFIGSLFTCTVTGLYTPICAEGGLPVCATNGLAYLYFENECRLNAYIYKQIYLGQRVPIKTDLENCLLNCHEIVCPVLFQPVCAQQVPDGPVRTVPNACLVNQLICATKRHWKIIGEGPCAPTLESTSLTHEEYSFSSPLSEGYIKSDQGPISTSYIASSSYSASAPDLSPYALQDQSENYIVPAPTPAPYGIPDTVPVASTYEEPQLAPCSASASDPLSYNVPDQSQSYQTSAPAPIAAPYAPLDQSQNYAAPAVSVPVPETCPYAASVANLSPSPTPSASPYIDDSQNYIAPAVQDPVATQYEAQQPAAVSYSAVEQITNYVAAAAAPASYAVQAPVSHPYEAPCSNADTAPVPDPSPYSIVDRGPNYPVIASAPAPYAAQGSIPAPYEAEQPAAYITAAAPSSSPVQTVYAPAPVPIPSPYDGQQPAPCPYPESTPAAASVSYAAIEQKPVPYVVPSPTSYVNEAPATLYTPSASVSDPVPYTAPEQTQSYVAPPPVPLPCAVSDPVVVPYEPQLASPSVYSSPGAVPAPSQYADQSQGYEAPAVSAEPCVDPGVQQKAANSYSAPASYAAVEQIQKYVAPAPTSSYVKYTEPASASAPCEIQQPTPYSNSSPKLAPAPYANSDPVPTQAPYEVQQPAPCPYAASDPLPAPAPVPCETQQTDPSTYAATGSAAVDLSYTAPDRGRGYQAIPSVPAPVSYSTTTLETAPSYQAQVPATCSCTARGSPTYPAQYKYTETVTSSPLLSNIYSRFPGNLDLSKLFQQLRRRFGIFVYRPRYTHIIITN